MSKVLLKLTASSFHTVIADYPVEADLIYRRVEELTGWSSSSGGAAGAAGSGPEEEQGTTHGAGHDDRGEGRIDERGGSAVGGGNTGAGERELPLQNQLPLQNRPNDRSAGFGEAVARETLPAFGGCAATLQLPEDSVVCRISTADERSLE